MDNFKEENMEYRQLFDNETKIRAFDKIAERYYCKNFGTMQKSDIDTLIFSIYLERLLDVAGDDNFNNFSDYTLSKILGISQSKISSLKIKKQLQYPREYDWRESFQRLLKNARYDNKKIKINIPDKNLYFEIINEVESKGSYVETSFSGNVLAISPADFIALMIVTAKDEALEEKVIEELRNNIKENSDKKIVSDIEKLTISEQLKSLGIESVAAIIEATVPVVGSYISKIIKRG